MDIAVLIPTLNEEITIAKVIHDFRREIPKAKIYVYDNNSEDNTVEIARKMEAIVKIVKKRGKGVVVQKMFDEVNADIFVLVDGDDTYPPEKVKEMIRLVENDTTDMVIGARLGSFKKEKRSFVHKVGNKLIAKSLNACFPSRVTDLLSGYRVMNKEIVKSLNLLSSGFAIETEITIKALENNFRIKEVPIQYRERPEGSKSKLKSFHDGYSILTSILNLFRDYRPLQFFLVLSIMAFAIATGFGYNVVKDLVIFGKVKSIPNLIMAILFILIAFQFLAMGFVTSSIRAQSKEVINLLKRLRK